MTGCILLAGLALVRPMEYPFKSGSDYVPPPPPVHYFNVRSGKAPEQRGDIARPTPPDPARKFEHAIEGHELHAFWEKPDPEPFSGVDPRKGYADWLEWCRKMEPDPSLHWAAGKRPREEVGKLVTEFVEKRSGHKAFELFIEMACNKENPAFSRQTREECEYFLRFAANHGSWRALEFFEGNGEVKSGKEYDSLLRRNAYRWDPPHYPSRLAGAPGNGMAGTFSRYDADEKLKRRTSMRTGMRKPFRITSSAIFAPPRRPSPRGCRCWRTVRRPFPTRLCRLWCTWRARASRAKTSCFSSGSVRAWRR